MRPLRFPKGDVFGDLTIIGPSKSQVVGFSRWLCVCVCGKKVDVIGSDLVSGNTKSCGCRRVRVSKVLHKKHGLSKSPEYQVWAGMIARCGNPKHEAYQYYGGRGISVCARWKSFEKFFEDIGKRPSARHLLERIDNDGNYGPRNVKWATRVEQGQNKRNNHLICIRGKEKTISAWARELRIDRTILKDRIRRGWTEVEAVETPVGIRRKK